MLSNDEVATLVAQLRIKHIENIRNATIFSDSSEDEAIDNDLWYIEELKRSGKYLASDHFSLDHIDAMAKCFDIDFQTFRHLDIGDAFVLEEEWEVKHASPKDIEEFYPIDFLTECELEADHRKDVKLIKEVGENEFFRLQREKFEKRRKGA